MTIETVQITDRTPIPLKQKLNPVWWLQGPDGWDVPDINNGEPYLPDVTNVWLRRFYWFIARNPLMNFVGYVAGVEDKNYSATGSAPVLKTTGRDCVPPQLGWRWAILMPPLSLPAVIVSLVLITLLVLAPWWISIWTWWIGLVALLRIAGPLPYISYWGKLPRSEKKLEFYLGWRPNSGGLGYKSVFTEKD
jgi:hypothetical protein